MSAITTLSSKNWKVPRESVGLLVLKTITDSKYMDYDILHQGPLDETMRKLLNLHLLVKGS